MEATVDMIIKNIVPFPNHFWFTLVEYLKPSDLITSERKNRLFLCDLYNIYNQPNYTTNRKIITILNCGYAIQQLFHSLHEIVEYVIVSESNGRQDAKPKNLYSIFRWNYISCLDAI